MILFTDREDELIEVDLKPHEENEIIKLNTFRILLDTKVSEWKDKPNESINICIPQSIQEYINTLTINNPKRNRISTETLVRDLILKGITFVSASTGGIENIDANIEDILENGIPIQ